MLSLQSAKERLQVEGLISNLRWLLLFSVAFVIIVNAINNPLDPISVIVPQGILFFVAMIYNITVVVLMSSGALRRSLPAIALGFDTILTILFAVSYTHLRAHET